MTIDLANLPAVKFIRTDYNITICDCCEREDLKCTMLLHIGDRAAYYGRGCAAKALGWKVSADKAEKIANGTAKLPWRPLDAVWLAHIKPLQGAFATTPARMEMDGVAIEIWDTAGQKRLPGTGWVRAFQTLHWRLAE